VELQSKKQFTKVEIKKFISIIIIIANIGLVKAQYTAIPDTCFEQHLIDLSIDTEGTLDGQVLTADITSVTSLTMNGIDTSGNNYGCYIDNLQGIDDFIALETLDFSINGVQYIDVSNLPNLKNLYCDDNFTQTLALPPTIEIVYARFNRFNQNIDFSQTIELKELYLDGFFGTSNSHITNLDMSSCINLYKLSADDNNVVNIDVSNSPLLEYLSIAISSGGTLTLTNFTHNNPNLKSLILIGNLSLLDVSEMINLEYLLSISNSFPSLNLTSNINLSDLRIIHNPSLNFIDLRNNNNNLISNFSLANTPNLTCIYVDNTQYSQDNWNITTGTFVETEVECDALVVNESILENEFNIYPNPVKNILHIKNETMTINKITVFDAIGKEVYKTNKTTIDFSTFENGLYIIKIKTNKHYNIITKKIIKIGA